MPWVEIRGRIDQRRSAIRARQAYRRRVSGTFAPTEFAPASELPRFATRLVPGGSPDEISRLRQEFPAIHDEFAGAAARGTAAILAGHWNCLGASIDLSGRASLDWHRDPRSAFRWPRDFHADVSIYELPPPVDVKYVWELGRQQFLVTLARSFAYNGDADAARLARHWLLDWIEHNPAQEGVHWTSALEVAMRSISWIFTLALTSSWPGWHAADLRRIGGAAVEHAEYLRRNFSLYASPYNHLIGEAAALYVLANWLQEHPSASEWRSEARDVLLEHGPRQFYGDGFCVEQAVGYHFYTLGLLLLARQAGRAGGDDLKELDPLLTRACRAGAVLRQTDGRWPAIGDVDSARAIPVEPADFWDFSGFVSFASVASDAGIARIGHAPGEELFLLCGVDGIRNWQSLPPEEKNTCAVLRDAGYSVSRDAEHGDWLLVDAGPLADGVFSDATPSVAHGHADVLQVLTCLDGRPVLVDGGTPSYAGDRAWVDYFRLAAAHNTCEIEGLPFARVAGRLAWSHVAAKPQLEANLSDAASLVRGRVAWGDEAAIERHVLAIPGEGVWIADAVSCRIPRTVRWHWQLPTDFDLSEATDDIWSWSFGKGAGWLGFATDGDGISLEKLTARADSPVAWQSTGYGERRPGQRVSIVSPPVRRIRLLSHVGRALRPACAVIGGVPVTAPSGAGLWREYLPTGASETTTIWFVETSSGPRMFSTGFRELSAEEGWVLLSGVGGLAAAELRK